MRNAQGFLCSRHANGSSDFESLSDLKRQVDESACIKRRNHQSSCFVCIVTVESNFSDKTCCRLNLSASHSTIRMNLPPKASRRERNLIPSVVVGRVLEFGTQRALCWRLPLLSLLADVERDGNEVCSNSQKRAQIETKMQARSLIINGCLLQISSLDD